MSQNRQQGGLTETGALRLEYFIIGLGIFAFILIFQPFSITLFAIGSAIVVLAALVNNLLPLAKPGVTMRTIVTVAFVVALIFCCVLLVSIAAAHLYGVFFLRPPDPATTAGKVMLATPPFYMQPLVWMLAVMAAAFAIIISVMNSRK